VRDIRTPIDGSTRPSWQAKSLDRVMTSPSADIRLGEPSNLGPSFNDTQSIRMHLMSSRNQTRHLAALVAVGVLLTACSSGGKNDADTATTGATRPAKSTIVIGQVVSITGANSAAAAASADVAQAWQKWVNNDLGGINGHPVKVITKDTKGDSATTATTAAAMINDDKIIAQVGGYDTSTDAVWAKAFADANIPVVGGNIINPVARSSPQIFSIVAPAAISSQLMVDAAKAVSAKKFGVALCSELPSCLAAQKVYQGRAQQLGVDFAGIVQVGAADPNYTAACLTLRSKGTDFLTLGLTNAVAVRLVKDCAKQGYKPDYYGAPSGSFDGARLVPISKTGVKFAGAIGGFPWWLDAPAIKQYRDVMAKYGDNHAVTENQGQSITWASFELFRKAMANAGDNPTAADVTAAMDKISNDDLGGLLPQKLTFTAGQPSKAVQCIWFGLLAEGKFSGGTPHCLDGSS
jgi:branched-chain amino acid transport system substrate-binding protein